MNFTRRHFAQLAAAGAAGQLLTAQEIRPVGYCIVGLGRISMQHFMPGCRLSKYSKVTAIVSGHRDKAEKWAADYGVPTRSIYSYDDYDAIADNKDIDAVYIALPNSMHAEYTIRAAQAGKHVLCEKPMSTSVADAEAMVAACQKANRKLQIAYRCQFEPCNLRAIELIRAGELGAVQSIESANGFNIRQGEWRYDGKLGGGGPLMDVGIYSLNACRYLTREEPVDLKGYASVLDQDGRFKDVEETLTWSMRFPSGITASCTTTYGASMPGSFTVYGSKGTLHMEAAFGYQGQHLTGRVASGPIDFLAGEKDPAHFPRQSDHLAECIAQSREPKTSGLEGLRDMQLIEKIYQSCGRRLPAIS
jgi:predicted dehydrogenase